jgi:hypothetical protein
LSFSHDEEHFIYSSPHLWVVYFSSPLCLIDIPSFETAFHPNTPYHASPQAQS